MPECQFGFHPARGSAAAVATGHGAWAKASSMGQVTGVAAFDLTAAFDTLDHDILCEKLRRHFHDRSIRWFRHYLEGRSKRAKYNQTLSSPSPVRCGVPHCSLLGPVLFMALIHDLPAAMTINSLPNFSDGTVGCADDIVMWISDPSVEGRSQRAKYNQTLSSSSPVRCGVPHRSLLGPVPFMALIHDLPAAMTINSLPNFSDGTVGCTDDVVMWISGPSVESRSQHAKYNQTLSSPSPVRCGVPHHSLLGPVPFMALIHDLPAAMTINSLPNFSDGTVGCADDVVMWISGPSVEGRSQHAKYNQTLSSPSPVRCGVPHCSLLGPVLFMALIYDLPAAMTINSLPNFSDGTVGCADDVVMWISGPSVEVVRPAMESTARSVVTYMAANCLALNPDS